MLQCAPELPEHIKEYYRYCSYSRSYRRDLKKIKAAFGVQAKTLGVTPNQYFEEIYCKTLRIT